MTLLDLYSGCGAMSTGLCIGASITGVKLVTVSYYGPFILFVSEFAFCFGRFANFSYSVFFLL